jgi:hypothetical protein
MNIEQPVAPPLTLHRNLPRLLRALLRLAQFALVTVAMLALLGRSTLDANGVTWARVNTEISGWGWDIIGWEAAAIAGKLRAGLDQPVAHLDAPARAAVVRDYVARSERIDGLEGQINRLAAAAGSQITPELAQVQAAIDGLRHEQHLRQAAVEQIIEGQVGEQLAAAGLTVGNTVLPPVLFTFSEAPRKLIVSPRHRIDTAYWAMLDPELPVDARERIETAIFANEDLSAYVTHIGGLGAFPTLVIDRGGLPWLLSTVAHEWVHNYLTLFPLGISYGQNAEVTILNETVADIVGDEIGAAALAQHYPELVPTPHGCGDRVACRRRAAGGAARFRLCAGDAPHAGDCGHLPGLGARRRRRAVHGDSAAALRGERLQPAQAQSGLLCLSRQLRHGRGGQQPHRPGPAAPA